MLEITDTKAGHEVRFPYKPYLVQGIKEIPGTWFSPTGKFWFVPRKSMNELLKWAQKFGVARVSAASDEIAGEIEPLPELAISLPLKRDPFPYQKRGMAYAIKHRRCIFGDQPGLGKTFQAIGACIGLQAKCILVICPATLKQNWQREWKVNADRNAMILSDKIKTSWPQSYQVGICNVFICNYESLKKYFVYEVKEFFDEKGEKKPLRLNHIVFRDTIELFDTVIIDESHRCKDGKTFQSKITMGISKNKQNVFALTGTPVVNKPVDLIAQLTIINRLMDFGGYTKFKERYCAGTNEASNLRELNFRLHNNCFFRREKKDVLKDLPDKMRSIVRCDISNRNEYLKAEQNLIAYLRENLNKSEGEISQSLRGETMVLIQILKKISAFGKIEEVTDHIQEVVDAGEKIVVFAHHKEIVLSLIEAFPGSVTIVGDDTMESRQRSVDSFQNDKKVQVIICNIKSGGVGITLTASSRVSFVELPWHAADCDQCEDRCHRIGQKDSVQATYFLGHNTVDEYIYGIIEKKRQMSNQVTGAKEEIETNMVDEFINLFMKEKEAA